MDESSEDTPLRPPTAERVARRALVLAGTVCRSFIEADQNAQALQRRVLAWIGELGLEQELEAPEAEMLSAPLGSLPEQRVVDGSWRTEGLVVLAWALGVHPMPQHDESVDPQAVADSVGFLSPEPTVLVSPALTSPDTLMNVSELLFVIHWRLREFSLNGRPLNFAGFARTSWFGPFDISSLRLVDDDLAIGPVSLPKTSKSDFRRCLSIAMERHRAINWVRGYSEVFSDTPTDT